MKNLVVACILAFLSTDGNSQCLFNRTAFEKYYDDNASNLDQIEGLWSVTISSNFYYNGELVQTHNKSQAQDWAVIRVGNSFRVCDLYGENLSDATIEFSATANKNIYLYRKVLSGEVTTANAVITSIGLLEYSYEVGKQELKTMLKEKYREGFREFREFTWIKTYPIQSTQQEKQKTSGTGIAISTNGLIVTCNHVVEGAEKVVVRGINNDFSKIIHAKVISRDLNNDLAIIQLEDTSFKISGNIPYSIAAQESDVGSDVFALGYPLRSTMGDEIKLTNGIISSKSGFQGDITTYQISVPVQPGNSGGPLFDDRGNLIGIISAKHLLAENASYAVKTSYMKLLLESLPNPPQLIKTNSLALKTLSEKVKILKQYTYIIEAN